MKNDKVKNQGKKKNPEALPPAFTVFAMFLAVGLYLYFINPNFFHQVLDVSVASVQSNPASAFLVLVVFCFIVWVLYMSNQYPETGARLVVATIMLLLIFPFLLRQLVENYYGGKDWEKIGQFGDSFGVFTSIFTGGAFVLLWMTYKAQKEELRATREIMDAQKSVMAEQKSVMDMQKFESAFFNILNVYSKSLAEFYTYTREGRSIPYTESTQRRITLYASEKDMYRLVYGVEALEIVVRCAKESLVEIDMLDFLKWSQSKIFIVLAHPPLFAPYHRHYLVFMKLLTFCDERCPSDSQKSFYAEIALSTLSDGEVILLALNCLQEKNKNYMNLLAKYFFFAANHWRLNLPEDIVEKIKEPFLDAQI